MSDPFVYEAKHGAAIEDAARDALFAADPGDTLRFTFNSVTVDYPVPTDEDESLYPHARKLVQMVDAERVRLDREAPPGIGDIVVTPDTGAVEYVVVAVVNDGWVGYTETETDWPVTNWHQRPDLRVVRRASYRTVGE